MRGEDVARRQAGRPVRRIVWIAGLLLTAGALAAEAPLALQGPGPYHTLAIPLAVRAQASQADLSDLRVLDAQGHAVPHAWVANEPVPPAQPRLQAVPYFAAPASAASVAEASQQGGWIVDLRAVAGQPQELQLDVAPGTRGVFAFEIEASRDLQRWHTVQTGAQLVALQHEGQRLLHASFELPPDAGGGYLRLRPRAGSTPAPVTGARVASVGDRSSPLTAWQWSDPIAPAQCQADHCDYLLPRHLPLQRLEIALAQVNTLARVELLAEPDVDVPVRGRHRAAPHHPLRDPLKALHRKTAPPRSAANEPAWEALPGGTVYWLRWRDTEPRSTVLPLPGGLYRRLRLQPVGGMEQLGSEPPALRVAGRAASLVFLARGAGPYRLAWGQTTPAAALPLAELMPGRRGDDPLPESSAQLAPAPGAASAPSAAAASATKAPEPVSSHKLWLWGAMAAALALLGAMAWSLLRPGVQKAS
jgi:Protein of unknown function (DUF3999)